MSWKTYLFAVLTIASYVCIAFAVLGFLICADLPYEHPWSKEAISIANTELAFMLLAILGGAWLIVRSKMGDAK